MTKLTSIIALLGAAACHSGDGSSSIAPDPAPTPGAPEAMHAEPPIDLASSVPAAALAFSYDGVAFRGGYLTHEVAVTDGIIDITPSHLDRTTGQRRSGGTIGLSTTAVSIGGVELAQGVGAPQQIGAGNVLQIPRGGLVEQITNREDGIEQAWRFDAQPVGGDLTVEVAVAGHRFVEATAAGLHFQSDRGLGFRYSHAIWRDAGGAAWDIEARYEGGRILITVPAEILAQSAYPAVLDPTVSGELFTDMPVNGTTGSYSQQVDLTSDGTQYFAVWQDLRDSAEGDIFATRLASDGTVVDTSGIRVNAAAGVQANPVAASVGNGYVVAWEHVSGPGNTDIAAAFVSTTGTVTQLGTIAGTGANETAPAIAARGGEALLVWQDGGDVRGAVFSGGAFGSAFAVAGGTDIEKEPAVSANPAGDYLVTFTQAVGGTNDNVRGQLVTAAGAPNGAAFDIAAGTTAEGTSAAAFDGTNHFVVWSVVHSGTSFDIAARRVGPTGTLLEAAPVDISLGASGQLVPDIACNAGGCLLTWEDMRNYNVSLRDIYGAVVSPTLAITAADIPVMSFVRQQTAPAVASVGTGYLTAWSDTRDLDTFSVRGGRVDATGAVLDPGASALVMVRSTSNYQAPAIGQTTGLTDVFFAESRIPDVDLVHVRFSSTEQKDATPRVVSAAPFSQVAPAATGMGATSFVAWQDARGADRDIFAARVNMTTGDPLDLNGIQITSGNGDQFGPKVASNGTSALVVWQDRRAGTFDIMGAIVSSAGAVTLTDIPICTAAGDQTRPNVAYDATNNVYLVVWTDPQGGTLDIRGARVSPAGAVLDAGCGAVISGAAGSQFSADVAAGGGQLLVAWEDRRNEASLGDIYGARVSAMGGLSVLDPQGIPIAVDAGSQQAEPTVAFGSGGSFVVAWTDDRNEQTTSDDILGAQVSQTGAVGPSFPIAATTESEHAPDLSPGTTPAKPFAIAYLKRSSSIGSTRIQLRLVTVTSSGGTACTQDSQCESGFCRDSMCCDSDCGGGGAYGNVGDCQACSTQHYGQVNGTCTLIINTAYRCRPNADASSTTAPGYCDIPERCDGISTTCPPDLGQHQSLVCNSTTGSVCPANDITGAPHICP